jgi:hypothetical protein
LPEISDARQHEITRRLWIHAALDQLARAEFDVKSELLIDLLIERHTPEPRTEGTLHCLISDW